MKEIRQVDEIKGRLFVSAAKKDSRKNFMTFSCKNFDFNAENCMKLNSECIPGRPGCVLKGKVKFSEDIEKRLQDLEAEIAADKRKRR